MARFFFDIHSKNGFHHDDFGDVFPNSEEARDQSQRLVFSISLDELPNDHLHQIWCEVRNDANQVIYRSTLTLEADAVDDAPF